jgi:urease accessory protein
MTFPRSNRFLILLAAASALALVLAQPVQAHGLAQGGLAAGVLHPLTGVDHLLLLITVGAAAAGLSLHLLLWAVAGAIGGGVMGAMGGTLAAPELLAALAIPAVALLVVYKLRSPQAPRAAGASAGAGALVALAVAIHALLHGQAAAVAAAAGSWWLGAAAASALVVGATVWLVRRLSLAWMHGLALLLALAGGVVSLGVMGMVAR